MGGNNPRGLRLVNVAENGRTGAIVQSAPLDISIEGQIVASIMTPATGHGGRAR